jgi:hypothetical protein
MPSWGAVDRSGRLAAMRRRGLPVARACVGCASAAAMALALAACGSGGDDATARATAAVAAGTPPQDVTEKDFARERFSHPTRIDNRWLPLSPGAQFVYEGRSNRGHGRRAHEVIFTVTDLTKVVDGVHTVVLWDQDINGGELLEAELAFHAQDDGGNVWNFGEYPEEHEGGKVTGAPDTWISGLAGAKAGIIMRGDPRVGTPSYRQGWAPKIEFGDKARIYRTGARNCVPTGCYRNVLVTDETNPFEPADGHQRKYYAPGVGNTRAAPVGGKEEEVLVLVKIRRLDARGLAHARRQARKLDARAYRVSRDVYRHTPPAERVRPAGQE